MPNTLSTCSAVADFRWLRALTFRSQVKDVDVGELLRRQPCLNPSSCRRFQVGPVGDEPDNPIVLQSGPKPTG